MGGVTGRTLDFTVVIQRECLRYFHVSGRRHIGLVPAAMIHPCPGVFHAAVMTRKTHVRRCHDLFRLVRNQVGSFAFDKKGVYPAIMTDGTSLG